jgi:hypothetical protein
MKHRIIPERAPRCVVDPKKVYVDRLHAEMALNRRFQVRFFVSEFLVNMNALHAAYPTKERRKYMANYFERCLTTMETTWGAKHWKVACYKALRRDYLAGDLNWAVT